MRVIKVCGIVSVHCFHPLHRNWIVHDEDRKRVRGRCEFLIAGFVDCHVAGWFSGLGWRKNEQNGTFAGDGNGFSWLFSGILTIVFPVIAIRSPRKLGFVVRGFAMGWDAMGVLIVSQGDEVSECIVVVVFVVTSALVHWRVL